MEVQKEAQRIMTLSVCKMYNSRLQRGGLRLHRSLQLSLVMRSARELYFSAKLEEEEGTRAPGEEGAAAAPCQPPPSEVRAACATPPAAGEPEPMETQDSSVDRPQPPAGKGSRKRRSSSLDKPGAAEAGLAPTKKARLEAEGAAEPPQPQGQEGPFPSLAKVLQSRFTGVLRSGPPRSLEPTAGCRPGDGGVLSILVRAVVAF